MTSDIRAEIRNLVFGRDVEGLASRLPALTDAERAAVAAELPGLLAELRESPLPVAAVGWDAFGRTGDDQVAGWSELLMMVGAATVPGPAGAVTWLMKRDLNPRWAGAPDPRPLVRAVSGRPAAWRADLAVRLARRVRRPDDRVVPLALSLLRAAEAAPPDHEPLVAAWLSATTVDADPLTPHLLAKIFDAAGAGRALAGESLTPRPSHWLGLAARTLPREQVITGCVSRFLRGGDTQDLRFFVRLHTLVAPTPEESAVRLRDYLRLLPVAPGPVADLAWRQVCRARLDPADAAEAVEAMTFRQEAKLAVKGLTWLDRDLARHPERIADHVTALTNAYAHASHEVRDRAVTLTLKHADHLTDPAPILEGAELLPASSARPLLERFAEGWTSEFTPGRLPDVTVPGPFPVAGPQSGPPVETGWIEVEAWLAAVVREAHTNPDLLRETLARRFGEDLRPVLYDPPTWQSPRDWCTALARELVNPGEDPGPQGHRPSYRRPFAEERRAAPGLSGDLGQALYDGMLNLAATAFRLFPGLRTVVPLHELPDHVQEEFLRTVDAQAEPYEPDDPYDPEGRPASAPWNRLHVRGCARPHAFLLSRLDELLRAAKAGALPPVLLATPTRADGHLDPGTLLDRLAECADSGREPLALDVAQALLRLPPDPAPDLAERAKATAPAAAAVVARWFERGAPPPPEVELTWTLNLGSRVVPYDEHVLDQRGIANVSWKPVEPTGLDALDALLAPPGTRSFRHESRDFWPGMTPHHRELAAAHLAIGLIDRFDPPDVGIDDLRELARAEGPSGPATALVLAYFLTVQGDDAVPPLLLLAAGNALPAAETGRLLGLLGRRTRYEADSALPSLELAARQGAHAEVWTILRHFLAVFLPRTGERARRPHTDAVLLAIDVAMWTGARGEIPEVAAQAGKPGSTSLTRACRTLHQLLTGEV
ncbi:hypothetical protein DMB42_18285 [Nonomuraea sp. WAC 01424]|uniref:hypothetical protein n=1 Tax=Nonomuraea sp. WAC 01424 TaxID=2203200 RepID=UPI000F7882B3|nr:hypothetical protein [Nonomuraea sp. WAC 01424]RSN09262.1 hypothetical protein DMB42_18285 [Nonomuraea sp. WAC 01424]